ncbi:Piso0_002205 [Millerozyma farinosa CBS 7064]|uniref:Piso0_002205 protein n=1 Tax=Pichia sorbitophila (strain ATCC MYA-4447 / BCRC 22081 / CBS 7064 / NBRC 10061 / NRRL Y-12695) TaxID=559304 RepID=G8YEE7_PICSO|nr:Piso0_002205 [Millerozyma farinosa CBS 7064]
MLKLRTVKMFRAGIGLSNQGSKIVKVKIAQRNFSSVLRISCQNYLQNRDIGNKRTMYSSSIKHLESENGISRARGRDSEKKNSGLSQEATQHVHEHSESTHEPTHEAGHSHSHDHGGLLSHSHSHSHSHQPNELLSTNRETILKNPAVRITWIGMLVNIGLVVSKGIGGVVFHSQSLIADAIHSVSDMIADVLTLATVNVSNKIGTSTHFPLGYGKIETMGSVFVSGVLLLAGVSVGWSSLLQVLEYLLPMSVFEYVSMIQIGHSHTHGGLSAPTGEVHSHSHSNVPDAGSQATSAATGSSANVIPDINAAWLAGASIIIKELLFRSTMKVAEETNSKVLVANAWHHRVDSLTAGVAVLTVTGGNLFNVAWLDAIGGLCVSVLIIRAGWGSFKTSILELVDRGEKEGTEIYETTSKAITEEINAIAPDAFTLDELSILTSGALSNLYVTLSTNKSYTIEELDEIQSKLIPELKKHDKFIGKVFIHFKKV